jgi:hypothetical protein
MVVTPKVYAAAFVADTSVLLRALHRITPVHFVAVIMPHSIKIEANILPLLLLVYSGKQYHTNLSMEPLHLVADSAGLGSCSLAQ